MPFLPLPIRTYTVKFVAMMNDAACRHYRTYTPLDVRRVDLVQDTHMRLVELSQDIHSIRILLQHRGLAIKAGCR